MIVRNIDEGEEDVRIQDFVECPGCGCNDCTILRYPSIKVSWFYATGKAKCNHCNRVFSIRFVEETTEPP